MTKLAQKLRKELESRLSNSLVDLSHERIQRSAALKQFEDDAKDVDKSDPLMSAYLFAFRRLVDFGNCVMTRAELKPYMKFMNDAEDYFQPSFPPMSPISDSYYNLWSLLDVKLNSDGETLGSCFVDCLRMVTGCDKTFLAIAESLAHSSVAFYEQTGESMCVFKKSHFMVPMVDLDSSQKFDLLTSSGFSGVKGHIWFGRVLPSPQPTSDSHWIMLGTPYIFLAHDKPGIQAFIERTIPKVKAKNRSEAYHRLMKFGLQKRYWPDFIFDAYLNFEPGAIYLTGVPDLPLSQPNSRESEQNGKWRPLSSEL